MIVSLDAFILNALGISQSELNHNTKKFFSINTSFLKNSRFDAFFFQPNLIAAESLVHTYKGGFQELNSILESEPINGVDSRRYVDYGRRYLRVKNIKPFEIQTDDIVFVENDPSLKEKKIRLLENDILITRKGTFGISAKVNVSNTDCLISSEIILIRVKKDSWCSSDFLVAWLNSSLVRLILNRYKSGAIMGHLTQEVIKQLPIPQVPPNLQFDIVTEVQRRRNEARRLRSEAEADWQAAKRWFEEQLLGSAAL